MGSLYTREHFAAARSRLREGGLFAQWLPLYQVSKEEFGIIARTMLDVFPLVTLWRGDFFADRPIAVLVGHRDATVLDPRALRRRLIDFEHAQGGDMPPGHLGDVAPFLLYYGGNLTAARSLMEDYPLNTDDRPLIEYRAPMTHRRQKAGEISWLTGIELMDFFDQVLHLASPKRDPYLKDITDRQRRFVQAGFHFHMANVLRKTGDQDGARQALAQFKRIARIEPPDSAGTASDDEVEQLRRELELAKKEYERIRALEERLEMVNDETE